MIMTVSLKRTLKDIRTLEDILGIRAKYRSLHGTGM